MTLADLKHFRDLLIERQQSVVDWLDSSASTPESDMRKARELLSEIRDALTRVDDHSFGACEVCHDPVELHRLEVQPLLNVCLGCFSKEEQAQLENDLYLANRIYRALLPCCPNELAGFEIAVRLAEARYVGGDYYDFLPPATKGGCHRVVVGDIMGKGVAAGLIMSNVQGAMRLLAETHASPAKLVCELNQWLCRNVPVTKFVSLICLSVEPQANGTARLVYANAGHCSPILVRKNGDVELLEQTGAVIGVREDFEYTEAWTNLDSGDLLTLYTDGIIEAENPAEDQFGEKRLADFLKPRRAHETGTLLDDLITHVKAFTLKPQLADDYIAMALRKT